MSWNFNPIYIINAAGNNCFHHDGISETKQLFPAALTVYIGLKFQDVIAIPNNRKLQKECLIVS